MGAKSWIARIPEGENREKAIARIPDDIRPGDKELALEWALRIESETKRQEKAESILKSWKEESPEAAAVYLNEHPDVASTVE